MINPLWDDNYLDQMPERPPRKVFIPPDPRTHHRGAVIVIQPKKSSKRRRGLRQSQPYRHGPVRVIVRDRQILMPATYRKLMKVKQSPSLSAESLVTAQESSGPEGAREAIPRPPQDLPTVENVAERIQDRPAS